MKPHPHVRSLGIQNFKGIAKLDIRLDDTLTLLAGVNGVGKTSAIEALLGAVTNVWAWVGPSDAEAKFNPTGTLLRYGANDGQVEIGLALERDVSMIIPIDAKRIGSDSSLSMMHFANSFEMCRICL